MTEIGETAICPGTPKLFRADFRARLETEIRLHREFVLAHSLADVYKAAAEMPLDLARAFNCKPGQVELIAVAEESAQPLESPDRDETAEYRALLRGELAAGIPLSICTQALVMLAGMLTATAMRNTELAAVAYSQATQWYKASGLPGYAMRAAVLSAARAECEACTASPGFTAQPRRCGPGADGLDAAASPDPGAGRPGRQAPEGQD